MKVLSGVFEVDLRNRVDHGSNI